MGACFNLLLQFVVSIHCFMHHIMHYVSLNFIVIDVACFLSHSLVRKCIE